MIVGHTKFSPDRFFGLIKKKYRHTFVSILDEIQEVVRKSICGQNIPQVTKHVNGRRLVNWYDWKSYVNAMYKTILNITSYHHFRFDHKSPGIVFVQILADSPEKAITISSTNIIDIHKFPEELNPKGLDIKRQWYLFEEIGPFCSSPEAASVTCPVLYCQNKLQLLLQIFRQTPVDLLRNRQGRGEMQANVHSLSSRTQNHKGKNHMSTAFVDFHL